MTNLAAASITATGTTTTRTLGIRFSDIVNVKDFGATGGGSLDDTTAIQSAFDYAFGTYAAPHGGLSDVGSNIYLNKVVFFPAGFYKVTSSIAGRTVTGAANNGSGAVRLTVSTTGISTGDNVNVLGIVGTTEANQSWFVTVIDSTHIDLQNSVFSNAYVSGGTISTPCLRLRMVHGAHIYGAGRFSTRIESASAGSAVICTNRMSYSRIDNILFAAYDNGIAFQLDAQDGVNDPGATTALQSNTFFNCFFGGVAGHPPAYGLKVGKGQTMGSENSIINCYFNGFTSAGISFWNYNACDNTIIGGNISECAKGIYVDSGSINTIHGVSFQANTTNDIHVNNGANDSYSICGCRSESVNFLLIGASQPFNISGCNQTNSSSGFFVKGAGYVTINSCSSVNGYIESGNGHYSVVNSIFSRSDYLTAGPTTAFASLHVTPMPITTQTGSSYTIKSSDAGTKVIFNSGSAQTVTVPENVTGTIRTTAGCWIEVQRVGAGEVSFVGGSGVTINSEGTKLRLNAQYSVGRLTCDGANLWTFSGDRKV